jgi:hypothetical protein
MGVVREHIRPFRQLLAALFLVALPPLIEPDKLAGGAGWVAFVAVAWPSASRP